MGVAAYYRDAADRHADKLLELCREAVSVRRPASGRVAKVGQQIPIGSVDRGEYACRIVVGIECRGSAFAEEIVEVGSHRRGIVEELEKAHIYIDQLQRQIKEQQSMLELLEERLVKVETGD